MFFSQVKEFISLVDGSKSLYGLQSETLDSLILDMLPSLGHTYVKLSDNSVGDDAQDVKVYLVLEILNSLRNNAGFHIPEVNAKAVGLVGFKLCGVQYVDVSITSSVYLIRRWIQPTCSTLLYVILSLMAFFRTSSVGKQQRLSWRPSTFCTPVLLKGRKGNYTSHPRVAWSFPSFNNCL